MLAYILSFILMIMRFYGYVLIASVCLSWLLAFKIINTDNEVVRKIMNFIYAVTEPVLAKIRMVVPPIGGIDFSPLIAFFLLELIQIGIVTIFSYF